MNMYSWSSSTCLWHATSAGVCTSATAAAPYVRTSAGWDFAGGLWLYMWSCWSSSSGRHTPVTSCWRPTACWLSSFLRCVPGLCWWACCSSTRSGEDQLQISLKRATRSYDSRTDQFFRHSFTVQHICVPNSSLSIFLYNHCIMELSIS